MWSNLQVDILGEFSERQAYSVGYAGLVANQGVEKEVGFHEVWAISRKNAEDKQQRHVVRQHDVCVECGKRIEHPEGKSKLRPARYCLTAPGKGGSPCYNRARARRRRAQKKAAQSK